MEPYIHAIVTRGVFFDDGSWHPIPYVDTHRAELVFRHKVLRLLRDRELITQERIDLLLSWHHSGFSVHNHTTVYPSDTEGLHRLACYLMRSPVNLSRLRYHPDSKLILYQPKSGQDLDDDGVVDPLEFLARVLIHIPQPNRHGVHFYGAYANRTRSTYQPEGTAAPSPATGAVLPRRALSKRWAELIFRIYEVDPLTCTQCGAPMKILAFITEPTVIRKILAHLNQKLSRQRAPPLPAVPNIH